MKVRRTLVQAPPDDLLRLVDELTNQIVKAKSLAELSESGRCLVELEQATSIANGLSKEIRSMDRSNPNKWMDLVGAVGYLVELVDKIYFLFNCYKEMIIYEDWCNCKTLTYY